MGFQYRGATKDPGSINQQGGVVAEVSEITLASEQGTRPSLRPVFISGIEGIAKMRREP